MIYFISSNTVWPSNPKKSVNFLYLTPELNPDAFRFGNSFCFCDDDHTVVFVQKDSTFECNYYNTSYNSLWFSDDTSFKELVNVNQTLFASYQLKTGTKKEESLIQRTNNFFDFYEKSENKDFWTNFIRLIKLVLKQSQKSIDTFFIPFEFFPKYLMEDDKSFFEVLFKNLNKFSSKTFLIIFDSNPIQLQHLNCFAGLLENYSKAFSGEVIFRMDCNHSFTSALDSNSDLLLYRNIYSPDFESYFGNKIQKLRDCHYNDLFCNKFDDLLKNSKNRSSSYYKQKDRLKESISSFNSEYFNTIRYKNVSNFYDRYLQNTVDADEFFRCFQRIKIESCNQAFNPADLGQEKYNTWGKLETRMSSYHKDSPDILKDKSNAQEFSDIKDLVNFDGYRKARYYCGKLATKSGICNPSYGQPLKDFIFEVAICIDSKIPDLISCLNKYGYEFTDYSIQDVLLSFVLKAGNDNNSDDKDRIVVYKKLKIKFHI